MDDDIEVVTMQMSKIVRLGLWVLMRLCVCVCGGRQRETRHFNMYQGSGSLCIISKFEAVLKGNI